jgi:hypothetical protein
MLDAFSERGAVALIVVAGAWPTLRGLSRMLKTHGQMEPIQRVASQALAGLLSQGPRGVGAIAECPSWNFSSPLSPLWGMLNIG